MNSDRMNQVIDALAEKRWATVEHFMPASLADRALANAMALWKAGQFRPANIGRAAALTQRPEIRGDEIHWWDHDRLGPEQRSVLAALDEIRTLANQELYLGLQDVECHYARYAPGAGYERHVDRFKNDDSRILSSVLYLNPEWHEEDGGQLWIYPKNSSGTEETVRVLPRAGTLVIFMSEDMPHEVRPSQRDRWSITGWMRRSKTN